MKGTFVITVSALLSVIALAVLGFFQWMAPAAPAASIAPPLVVLSILIPLLCRIALFLRPVVQGLQQKMHRFYPDSDAMRRAVLRLGILALALFAAEQTNAQSCNCKEYIYLNEPFIGAVLKFEVGAGVPLTEVLGANGGAVPAQHWYPGLGASALPSPHGVATDLNGNLYVGSNTALNSPIRKFNCDGVISPIGPTTINSQFWLTSMFSIGNTIYTSRSGGPAAYNSCTGALLGTMCLNGSNGLPLTSVNIGVPQNVNWGLSYNATTQRVYATGNAGPRRGVWAFTKAQLEAGIAGGPCINILIPLGTTSILNPGDNFLPNNIDQLNGVVGDNAGNIYVAGWYAGAAGFVLKYNAAGQFIASAPLNPAFQLTRGVVWSESNNRIYVANTTDDPAVDCISAFDAITMAYVGTAAANPNLPADNSAKALVIIKECCPVNLPATFSRNVCGSIGTKFFLNQEAFNTCDGIVCGASWVPTALTGMTFDPCDNSVTITGFGCGTFNLSIGAVLSTGCGAQSSTFTICNNPPTITANIISCNQSTGQYTLGGQVSVISPPTTGTLTVSVSGGGSQVLNAPFVSPISYTISGLTSDALSHTVTAVFSDDVACSASVTYTAPSTITNPSAAQTICEGSAGANITVNTNQNGSNSIRFVRFATDQTANNAAPTAIELAAIYAGGTILATVTPTGAVSPYTATLTAAAAGWAATAPGVYYIYAILNPDPGALCRPVQEIIVTIVDKPELTANDLTVCESVAGVGTTVNLTNLVQNPDGATLAFSEGGNPIATPNAANLAVGPHTITVVATATGLPLCSTTVNFTVTIVDRPDPTVTNGQVCGGSSIDLATLVTSANGGTLTYYTTLANAQAGTNALVSPVVTLTAATNYYVRSAVTSNGTTCHGVREITVTIAPADCGSATVTGGN